MAKKSDKPKKKKRWLLLGDAVAELDLSSLDAGREAASAHDALQLRDGVEVVDMRRLRSRITKGIGKKTAKGDRSVFDKFATYVGGVINRLKNVLPEKIEEVQAEIKKYTDIIADPVTVELERRAARKNLRKAQSKLPALRQRVVDLDAEVRKLETLTDDEVLEWAEQRGWKVSDADKQAGKASDTTSTGETDEEELRILSEDEMRRRDQSDEHPDRDFSSK